MSGWVSRATYACALVWLSGCVPEDIIVAEAQVPELPPPVVTVVDAGRDSGSDDQPTNVSCRSNEDCPIDEFCSKRECNNTRGRCERRPATCDSDSEPVCGCDKVNYFNDCLRKANGIESLARRAECQAPLRCGGPSQCPGDSYCALLFPPNTSSCPMDVQGVCWVLPPSCADASGSSDRYRACGDPDAECTDLCTAIESEAAHTRAQRCSR